MAAETRLPQQEFADHLDELRNDPHGSLITMVSTLNANLGWRIGFREMDVKRDPERIRGQRLDVRQYESIKDTEDMVKFMSRFGMLTPAQLGIWFETPNERLEEFTPLQSIGYGSHDRTTPVSRQDVLKAAFFSIIVPTPEAFDAYCGLAV